MEQIKEVNWLPAWGEVRLGNMIKDRADWCISRQRVWGFQSQCSMLKMEKLF